MRLFPNMKSDHRLPTQHVVPPQNLVQETPPWICATRFFEEASFHQPARVGTAAFRGALRSALTHFADQANRRFGADGRHSNLFHSSGFRFVSRSHAGLRMLRCPRAFSIKDVVRKLIRCRTIQRSVVCLPALQSAIG